MGRKTIDVKTIVDQANQLLAYVGDASYDNHSFRYGVIAMVENALHASKNYRGFRYLNNKELPAGVDPGMWLDEKGNLIDTHVSVDSTRRHYFLKNPRCYA